MSNREDIEKVVFEFKNGEKIELKGRELVDFLYEIETKLQFYVLSKLGGKE